MRVKIRAKTPPKGNMIVYNAIQTPDGTILESKYRHDYVSYKDANGDTYFVDGGLDYLRRALGTEKYKELSEYLDAPIRRLRKVAYWGTRGKDGKGEVEFIRLKDIDDDHLDNILALHLSDKYRELMTREREYRDVYLANIIGAAPIMGFKRELE